MSIKVTVDVLHPEGILFGDEVGIDVCQEGDGQFGSQVSSVLKRDLIHSYHIDHVKTYLVLKDYRAEIRSSSKISRWTTIGFVAADGELVMTMVDCGATSNVSHR